MATVTRARPVRPIRRAFAVARIVAATGLGLLSYCVLTASAMGPAAGPVTVPLQVAAVEPAEISYDGVDPVITGSVAAIFEGAGFVGPNRGEKRDRARLSIDVASFSQGFDSARLQIAAQRNPALLDATPDGTSLADAGHTPDSEIQLASLGPAAASSAALAAINTIDQSIPMPAMASADLAYARANTPAIGPKEVSQYDSKELWCLATAIYFESRGETYRGQIAVAQVVMNRVAHRLYPKTICGVVFQNQHKRNACQFSFACDGIPETVNDRKSWAQAEEIAEKVTTGELYLPEVANATHYHASYVYPDWAPRLKKLTKIGLHIFYRFKHG